MTSLGGSLMDAMHWLTADRFSAVGTVGAVVVALSAPAFNSYNKNRERLETLARQVEPQLLVFRQATAPGGLLATSPGSAQGQEAIREIMPMFGMISEMILLTPRRRWGKWREVRELLIDLNARCSFALSSCIDPEKGALSPDSLRYVDANLLHRTLFGKDYESKLLKRLRYYEKFGAAEPPPKTSDDAWDVVNRATGGEK